MISNADMPRAALAYAEAGWAIFPCHWPIFEGDSVRCSCGDAECGRHTGKHPLGLAAKNGVLDASSDPELVKWWWNRWPDANIGLAAGSKNNMLVLDVDPEHDGDKTLAALEAKHGALPKTLWARTGSDGKHICFTHVDGLKNSVGRIGGGLDIRTDGGYVVAAPSRHKSGRRYKWGDNNVMGDLAAAPSWLNELIRKAAGTDAAPSERRFAQTDYWCQITEGVPEGKRNDAMTKLAGLLIGDKRLPLPLSLELLHGFNLRRCRPPLSEDEIDAVFMSIAKRHRSRS